MATIRQVGLSMQYCMRRTLPVLVAVATFLTACSDTNDGDESGLAPALWGEIRQIEITVDELVFDAIAAGPATGEPVMLLHGFPSTSHQFEHQVRTLGAAGYYAVAPDQRGYSPRARPATIEQYSVQYLVDDVIAMADQLGFERFHLVGHDWGANVTWAVGGNHPERLISLNPISVPHPLAFAQALLDSNSDQAQRSSYIEFFQTPNSQDLLLANDAQLLRAIYSGVDEEDIAVYLAALGTPDALSAALNWYRALTFGSSLVVSQIDLPTMFIWSDEDAALGPDGAMLTVNFVDGPYEFEILEGVNHWVTDIAPEAVSRLLLQHINTYSERSDYPGGD